MILSVDLEGIGPAQVTVDHLTIAGWTGRNPAAVQAHIAELALLGVAPPPHVPMFYRASASRLSQASTIEVTGSETSGEAEFVLMQHGSRLWVLAGSDHTDRRVEAYDVTVSKQMCDKPVSGSAWDYGSVAGHWDQLRLRSWADGTLYQDGPVSGLLSAGALLAEAPPGRDGSALFGGTVSVIGAIRPALEFRVSLSDPVLGRDLMFCYQTQVLGS